MGNALFDMMDALDALMEARGQRIDVLQTEVCVLRAECRAAADEIVRLRVQQARILAHYRGRLRDEQERRRRELDMCREKLTLRESASTRLADEAGCLFDTLLTLDALFPASSAAEPWVGEALRIIGDALGTDGRQIQSGIQAIQRWDRKDHAILSGS